MADFLSTIFIGLVVGSVYAPAATARLRRARGGPRRARGGPSPPPAGRLAVPDEHLHGGRRSVPGAAPHHARPRRRALARADLVPAVLAARRPDARGRGPA